MDEQQNPWQILSEKKVYDNKWIAVTEYDVINPSGGKGIHCLKKAPTMTMAILSDIDGNIEAALRGHGRSHESGRR